MLHLPHFSPSPSDCIAWAEDGVIAVAGLEHVAILGNEVFLILYFLHMGQPWMSSIIRSGSNQAWKD